MYSIRHVDLEVAAKKAVMVMKFVLLIADGADYQSMINNANHEILQREVRDWDQLIHCDFSSRNRVIAREEQVKKISLVLSRLDVRGKVNVTQPQKIIDLI